MKKIAVIMHSYLKEYEGSASDRVNKFHRAVKSFLNQDYPYKQLVVVSDDCNVTDAEVLEYLECEETKSIVSCIRKAPRQTIFKGDNLQAGIDYSVSDIICYLDTDDFFGDEKHLTTIVKIFDEHDIDWFYMNDYLGDGLHIDGVKKTKLEFGSVGVSSIAHKKLIKSSWTGCDGWGNDWMFIQKMINEHPKHIKAKAGNYRICHMKNLYEI